MKTKFLAIVSIIVSAVASTKITYAATVNNGKEVSTVLTNISQINKIEVHGNVELYVSDGNTDQVKVYNQYYAESALVQSQNGVLRISSYKAETFPVTAGSPEQGTCGNGCPHYTNPYDSSCNNYTLKESV